MNRDANPYFVKSIQKDLCKLQDFLLFVCRLYEISFRQAIIKMKFLLENFVHIFLDVTWPYPLKRHKLCQNMKQMPKILEKTWLI